MAKPNAILDEPLTLGQERISRSISCSGKHLSGLALLIGLVYVGFFTRLQFSTSEGQEPAISMLGMRGSASAMPMSMSCPRTGVPMSVNAMQETLQRHGVPSSQLERVALSQYAATCNGDLSTAAQAKEEFSRLDPVTQGKLKKLARKIVVKASSLTPTEMAGITAPLGFWDPAGLATKYPDRLAVFRSAELKHGRVGMVAVLGQIWEEKSHPFFDAWGDGPFVSDVANHFSATAKANFWPAFWALCAGHELLTELGKDVNEHMGDYGFDPLNLKPTDPAALKELETKELNNGRLAMLAAAGFMAQELVTGKAIL